MESSDDLNTPGRVFITGANGFIGRAVARRYRRLGAEVCGIDFQADDEWGVVAGDIRHPEEWSSALQGCDVMIHTAAVVSMVGSMETAWDVNVRGTRALLSAARESGIGRFLHLSSVAAFGFDFPDGVDETWPLRTNGNSYVDTKVASEHTVLAAHAAGELDCTIVRPGDVYGPGSRAWVVEPLKLIKARQFMLPANGRGVFSPVYIDDLVEGIVRATGHKYGSGQIFTITEGIGVSCEAFFSNHFRWLGKGDSVPSMPTGAAVALASAIGGLARLVGRSSEMGAGTVLLLSRPGTYSIEKARQRIGYVPQVDLTLGLQQTAEWVAEQGLDR